MREEDLRIDASGSLEGTRVVFALGCWDLGGSERQAMLLARGLKDEWGARVSVIGLSEGGGKVAELCDREDIGRQCVPYDVPAGGLVGALYGARFLGRFVRAVRRLRADVLLPYTMLPNMICGLAWRWTGARLSIWNQRDAGIPSVPWLERRAAKGTPCFVSNSLAGIEYLTSAYGLPAGAIHHVPNGVALDPPAADRAQWRGRLGLDGLQPAVCMLANLQPHKDHATLLRAWRMVGDGDADNQRPVLLLAGRHDRLAEPLRKTAVELGVADRVRFLGAVDDVAGLLGAVDLAVFSSRREGCPNGVLEPMAAGLAVVATDIPGTREALGANSGACLVPPGNAEEMASAIRRFLADPEARRQAGTVNRQRIAEEFSPRSMCRAMAELIARPARDHRSRLYG